MRPLVAAAMLVAMAACGGSSSSPFAPAGPNSGNGTLTGTLLTYGDRTALSGVSVKLGSSVATTDSQGRFSLVNLPATGAAILTASAPGHVFRGVGVSLSQASV